MLSFALLICLTMTTDDAPRPFLGVSAGNFTGAVTIDGRTYTNGILVTGVTSGSPAEQAGLRSGDVILQIDDTTFDGPADELRQRFTDAIVAHSVGDNVKLVVLRDTLHETATLAGETVTGADALARREQLLADQPAGTPLTITARRQPQLLELAATLVAAPETASQRQLPPNAAIYPDPLPPLPAEQVAERLIDAYGLTADYADQRARLARLVDSGDPFRLSRFAYAMREPFTTPAVGRDIADVPADLPGLLRHAALMTDVSIPAVEIPALVTSLTAEGHAEQIADVLERAHAALDRAFANVTAEEQRFLLEHVTEVGDCFRRDIMVLRDKDRERVARLVRFVELSVKIDRAALTEAALHVATLADPAYLDGLRKDLAQAKPHSLDAKQGRIVIAGPGDDLHTKPAAVIVDVGGNDFYSLQTTRPLAIVLDLDGDDVHQATADFSQAAGILGVALLCDVAGDDTYIGRRWCQGAAVCGVAVLTDQAGNDTYRGADYSQGMAYCGTGLLLDAAGDDRYEAPRFAQALALPGGFAAVIERSGDDRYYCKGRDLGAYGTPGIFAGWGQGCASGFRSLASGGIALLLDESGDDRYEAGNFSQGGGYYFGWGQLYDRAGDDEYIGERYSQAFAAHEAIGVLEDFAGDDTYEGRGRPHVGQSCSWDETITFLLDHAGNDRYSAGADFSLAAAANNGLAVLIDYAGVDEYRRHRGRAVIGTNDYHGGSSLGLLLDLGGDVDSYPKKWNDTGRYAGQHGFFIDAPADLDTALADLEAWMTPSPEEEAAAKE